MEIFKYEPNWERIEQRRKINKEHESQEGNTIILGQVMFHMKKGVPQKRLTEECGVCSRKGHLSSVCPERAETAKAEKEEPAIYRVGSLLSPTTVKVMNLPTTLEKYQLRDILKEHGIRYDSMNMVHTNKFQNAPRPDTLQARQEKEEFKGIVYLHLPTKEEGSKCIAVLDGMRMDVQVVSAMVVENRQP
ncbi:hypothetical protein NECID01_1544 [Nematocida sp. AWRm77]|nr:hypothetical protein NECID01_1544 [Nematocida sp. AWRm77]